MTNQISIAQLKVDIVTLTEDLNMGFINPYQFATLALDEVQNSAADDDFKRKFETQYNRLLEVREVLTLYVLSYEPRLDGHYPDYNEIVVKINEAYDSLWESLNEFGFDL